MRPAHLVFVLAPKESSELPLRKKQTNKNAVNSLLLTHGGPPLTS